MTGWREEVMQSNDRTRLAALYVTESEDGLQVMEESLIALERGPDDPEPLGAIFRVVHTIKGGAGALGWDALSAFTHLLEDVLVHFRDGAVETTPARITLLLQVVDVLRGMLRAAADGRLSQLRATDRQLVLRLLPDELRETLDAHLLPDDGAGGAAAAADGATHPGAAGARAATSLRIDMRKLDALLDLTGEIAVARSRLMQLLQSQRHAVPANVQEGAEDLDGLLADLQATVIQLRLVPLGPTFRQHERTVRDVAAAHGKLAQLVIDGAEVEVDAAVVSLLRDPLTHLVRNAIDHGLEYPAARAAAGKHPCGTIAVRAFHERGSVVVELSDDGAGLDRDRILRQARARGLVADAEPLGDRDVFRLITLPGFSTAEQVTDLSGRGVGLDVVRRNVDALRGSIAVESVRGAGTTFRLRLPLTLAIIQGLAVAVGSATYVIPLDAVSECLDFPPEERRRGHATGILNVRGEPLQYLRLHQRLQAGGPARIRQNVVIVRDATGEAGLVVDAVLGEIQAVIKPLGGLFQRLTGVSGSTVTGDGRVALILDVSSLLAEARAGARGVPAPLDITPVSITATTSPSFPIPDGGVLQ